MPGLRSEEEQSAIVSEAEKELKDAQQQKGLKRTLHEYSNGKLDDATLRYLRDKKGGGADGGASRSIGHGPANDKSKEGSEHSQEARVDVAAKERARVLTEHRSHQLDHYYSKRQERSR